MVSQSSSSVPKEPISTPAGAVAGAGHLGDESETTGKKPGPLGGRLVRLLISMVFGAASISMIWGAVPQVLLPLQVQAIAGEDAKGAALALVTGIGAVAATLAQPLAGMLSDRTRSRFGRRGPWLVGGALVGSLGMIGMGVANSLTWLIIGWIVVQISYNFAQGPFSAVMPDRVPSRRRGLFAALGGLGGMIGGVGGAVVGAMFASSIPTGYLALAGFALLVMVLFVVLNPDRSNRGEPLPPFSFGAFLRTFWVNPIAYPDFFWGFVSRFGFVGGYFLITGYQLYLLQDYIGVGDDAVAIVPLLSVAALLTTLVATVVSGPLSDRIGRRKPFVSVASFILAIGIAVPWVWPTVPGMVGFALLAGLGFGAYIGVDQALMTEVLPSKSDFAKDLGVLNIAQTLPQTLGVAVAGVALIIFGGYWVLFPIGIAAAIIGGLAVLMIKSVR